MGVVGQHGFGAARGGDYIETVSTYGGRSEQGIGTATEIWQLMKVVKKEKSRNTRDQLVGYVAQRRREFECTARQAQAKDGL